MNKTNKILLLGLGVLVVILIAIGLVSVLSPIIGQYNFAVLNPKGVIAQGEKNLMLTATLLMMAVVIPVFIILFLIVWKFRDGKTGADYSPNMHSSFLKGAILWAIPAVVIFTIGVMNWQSTHELDPYKQIASAKKPIIIQVIAMRWKWLFIYPEQNIATVNFIEFPAGTPLEFQLTADNAPMNSFWLPQLGGQMYAMAGMSTQLHLMASSKGEYTGSAAEINGSGLAGMRFVAKAVSDGDFSAWANSVKASKNPLTQERYSTLVKPSESNPIALYSTVPANLYNTVMMKYMGPASASQNQTNTMDGMK